MYGQCQIAQRGSNPGTLHIHNLALQPAQAGNSPQVNHALSPVPMDPALAYQGGRIPQVVHACQPNPQADPAYNNPLGPINVSQVFHAAHALGDIGNALCCRSSITLLSNLSLIPIPKNGHPGTMWFWEQFGC